MDSLSLIGDRSKLYELKSSESEEYYTKMMQKNYEILKALDLNNWTEIKKKERNESARCLKKWKCYSAGYALESCATSFMDSIDLIERKINLLSELKKCNKLIAECEKMSKIMKKGIEFNKEHICTLKNNYLLNRDETKYSTSDFYLPQDRPLIFERINDLIKKSNEGEKELEKLRQMKKQLIGE